MMAEKRDKAALSRAYEEGRKAYRDGVSQDNNPFSDVDLARVWELAWLLAKGESTEKD